MQYYADLSYSNPKRTIRTKNYNSSAELLNAMASNPGVLVGADVRFYNIETREDGAQLLHNGL